MVAFFSKMHCSMLSLLLRRSVSKLEHLRDATLEAKTSALLTLLIIRGGHLRHGTGLSRSALKERGISNILTCACHTAHTFIDVASIFALQHEPYFMACHCTSVGRTRLHAQHKWF